MDQGNMDLEFESQRLSSASSSSFSSSLSRSLLERGSGPPLEPSARSNLARIAPFTFKAVARMHAIEVKATKEAIQGKGSTTGSEEARIYGSSYDLDCNVSRVT